MDPLRIPSIPDEVKTDPWARLPNITWKPFLALVIDGDTMIENVVLLNAAPKACVRSPSIEQCHN
ncbi:hypothetical protein GOP47_0022093 [Adiantum capillus-veneris]|uniref:Uncharacterized protein n=1 Tax=Adiantum capillus-veneris TaxID=13818 RepID=A0A9D4U8N6_ADICA|nr:hypothetical protein GOP47_0022093 [Adiantum capillus-veneris]